MIKSMIYMLYQRSAQLQKKAPKALKSLGRAQKRTPASVRED
jgi:hypothetical protein